MSLNSSVCYQRELTQISIILDPRTAVEISEGGTATLAFGAREVLEHWWNPMEIPRSPNLEEIINSMEDSKFGMNVKYIESL